MELLQLRYFTAAAEEGSISAGARKLGMTQPPVSTQIKLLESELDCRLIKRGSRKTELTEEGKLLYERAVSILNMTESARRAVTEFGNAESGTLRIGVVSSLIDLSAQKWFPSFSAMHRNINYELTEGSTYQLLEKLRSHLLDVALVRTPFSSRGFECFSLSTEDMLLIGTEKIIGKESGKISLAALSKYPLIIYRRWKDLLERAFAVNGCLPRIICTADDARTCAAWAEAGIGAAVVPSDILLGRPSACLLSRAIEGLNPAAETTLAVNAGGCDTAAGKAFVDYFTKANKK